MSQTKSMILAALFAALTAVGALIRAKIKAAQAASTGDAAVQGKKEKTKITIPYFAINFLLVIVLNTWLQQLCDAETVKQIPLNGAIEYLDTFLLTMAMTALGTDTSFDKFKAAGAKPFLLAFLLFIWLVVGGYFLALTIPSLLA